MDTNTATVVTAIATSVSHSRSYYGNYSGLSDPDIFGSGQGQCISRQNSPYYFQRSEMSEKQKQTRTIRLFLSYASEQKALVTQVCEILTEQFELWFDKDNLTGGVSLFDEISDGLGWCDYGVVFLSKDYLAKGWTNAEFSGLWTKQIAKRSKVILPIWYDVTAEEVYQFSPMVANLTAISSQDAGQIAEWIRKAVGVAEQSREVYDPLKKAIMAMQSDAASARLWPSWSSSQPGFQAALNEWEQIAVTAERVLLESGNSTFSIQRGENNPVPLPISIEGPPVDIDGRETIDEKRIIYLLFTIRTASNSVFNAECTRRIVLRFADYFQTGGFEEAACFSFRPYCTSDGKPIWRDDKGNFFDTRTLVEDGLKLLTAITHKAVTLQKITRYALPQGGRFKPL